VAGVARCSGNKVIRRLAGCGTAVMASDTSARRNIGVRERGRDPGSRAVAGVTRCSGNKVIRWLAGCGTAVMASDTGPGRDIGM